LASRPTSRWADHTPSLFRAAGFVLPFVAVLACFRLFDFYDRHFFDAGITAFYNLLRVVFILYLFPAICVPGVALLSAVGGASTFAEFPPLPRLVAGFFCGAALWHALLLILGFLDLYTYPVAVALSIPALALAPHYLRPTARDLAHHARAGLRALPPVLRWATVALAAAALVAAALLLLIKGLYPAGGHDYFNHYNGYYQAVLRTHGLWPNDVWYQFYYSKGMGLFFLATLLTDPLAPSLVTFCFAVGTALALFLLIERMAPAASFWPWAALITFFVVYSYTTGTLDYLANGGWGDFQKPHEISSALAIGFVWLCAGLQGAAGRERRIWFCAAAACIFIVAAVELVTVLLLGLLALLLAAFAALRRRSGEAGALFGLSLAGGCGLASVLALNYLASGVPSDQLGLEVTWRWADLHTLERWGALPYFVLLLQGRAALYAQSIDVFSRTFLDFCRTLFRVELLKTLWVNSEVFLALLCAVAAYRLRRPHPEQSAAPLGTVLLFLAITGLVAATAGIAQPISFYRYSSFCLPAVLAFTGCGWLYIAAPIRGRRLGAGVRYALPVVLMSVLTVQFVHQKPFRREVLPHALAFAGGTLSIKDAYVDQQGWPGRSPWGGIFPGMIGAWRAAGPGTRIWSMHLLTYCMLPQCRAETFVSFILSPHFVDLLAGSAEETRDILHREKLDYFFYTRAMDVCDVLPLMQPFTPDKIADYLGVKWTDGTSYLLTWLGPGVAPLTPEWVAQYRKAIVGAPSQPRGFPVAQMLDLRRQMNRDPAPRWGRDLTLP